MPKVTYDYGDTVRARVTYTDPDTGDLTDPVTVTCQVRQPDGTLTTYTYGTDAQPTRVSIGLYQMLIDLDDEGTYKWKWEGAGVNETAVDYDECDSLRKF
jgi:hypothetical protein